MAATGKRIGMLLKLSKLEPKELSEVLGITVQAVYKWKRGECLPDTENMYIMSQMLGIRMEDLLVAYPNRQQSAGQKFFGPKIWQTGIAERMRLYVLYSRVYCLNR